MTAESTRRPLVVFEGIDGSGKSTLSRAVRDALALRDPWVHHQAFPSHEGEIGKLVRKAFTGEVKINLDAMGHLMVADCIDFAPVIRKTVNEGITVLCDRYAAVSGWVYQTSEHAIDQVLAYQQRGVLIPMPDMTFILDIPEKVAEERRAQRNQEANPLYERDSQIDYYRTLRGRYLAYYYMHRTNTILLDATEPLTQLVGIVLKVIDAVVTAMKNAGPDTQVAIKVEHMEPIE